MNSTSLQMVGHEYVRRRKQFKKSKLSWRKSQGSKRSLGWIPVRKDCISYKSGSIYHNRQLFDIWDSFELSNYTFGSGSFNEDSRGRWYFNVVIEVAQENNQAVTSIGIDLGCKEDAVSSCGKRLASGEYRKLQQKLAQAQIVKDKKCVKAIHAKIKNKRHDNIHKFTRKLVNENAGIFIGNVSSQKFAKTKMAKSVLDAGWGTIKTILEYKCEHAGIAFEEINETNTTVTCSCCHKIPDSSPKGRAGLRIREWTCCLCGTAHDRDINAAENILALGHERLAVGIPH